MLNYKNQTAQNKAIKSKMLLMDNKYLKSRPPHLKKLRAKADLWNTKQGQRILFEEENSD